MQTSAGFQSRIAPSGQSLNDLRVQQQYTEYNGLQNPQQNTGMMNQPQNFNQFNNGIPNGYQYPMQTGMSQQHFMNNGVMNNGGGSFVDPRPQHVSPIQQQPTSFQSPFSPLQQQFPQQTGINSFLPPALVPTPTGAQGLQQQNSFNSTFNPPPMPPMPQQNTMMPLVPQKTGPPPPVRFGVSGDTKKLMPQATGRRANLSQASKLHLSFVYFMIYTDIQSSAKSLWVLTLVGLYITEPSVCSFCRIGRHDSALRC
jgi:hypothetical protein